MILSALCGSIFDLLNLSEENFLKIYIKWMCATAVLVIVLYSACKDNSTESNGGDNAVTLTEIDDVLANPFKGFNALF